MTYEEKRVILKKQSGWFRCPRCHRKLVMLKEDTTGENFPIFCIVCKTNWIVTIQQSP